MNPGPRVVTPPPVVTTPPVVTPPRVVTPPQKRGEVPAKARGCAAKSTKRAKRRCLRAQAIKKCKAKKTGTARKRCVLRAKRRFK